MSDSNMPEIEKILYSQEEITSKVEALGAQITKDYDGSNLVVIGVVNGAVYFFSDLTRSINLPIEIDTIGFGNIPDTTSKTGRVKITKEISIDIEGKDVIIVEDVVRTGLTTAYLLSELENKNPKSISIAAMLFNPDRLLLSLPIKYYGYEINDKWLIGYGLDINGIGRNLPCIAVLKK